MNARGKFFKKILLIYFRKRGREGKERVKNIVQLPFAHPQLGTWPATQACALTGNPTSDLSIRLAFNPLSHASQGVHGKFSKAGQKVKFPSLLTPSARVPQVTTPTASGILSEILFTQTSNMTFS